MYELKKRQVEQAYKKQQKEIEKLEEFIAKNKARVATTNLAKDRQRKLDRMEKIEIAKDKPKPTFAFREARTPSREVVAVQNLVIGYDEPLTKPLNFSIERNQKIAIKGVNGLGKSTLLNTILGIIKPIDGQIEHGQFLEVGYFKQEEAESTTTALDEIWNTYPFMTNGEVRSALAKCGLNNDHITSQMRVLSGGENAKVRLCKLMLRDINFLVLDEPTNHLDVDAKDELKKAIREFKGTVLIVSHEPEFYMDVATEVWNVEEWTTKII
jgi:ATPase subunit of ABC transporter with duplicated ATPase domains